MCQPRVRGDPRGGLERGLEVVALFDQLRAERLHRAVLAGAVAVRDDERGGNAVARRGKGDRLPVVAARGGDHPFHRASRAPQVIEIHEPAAHLEGADRRVVFVLDPDRAAAPRVEQRPPLLRRRRHRLVDDRGRLLQLAQRHHVKSTFI